MKDYEVIKIDNSTWRIENNGVRFFLLEGNKEALLIDSGMTLKSVKSLVESFTSKPVKLLNTHADLDHIGGNDEFSTFLMHPSEASNFYNTQGRKGIFIPVYDGDVLDLGDRVLEIIALPGHTPGSIAILDRTMGVLYGGDTIQDGRIFMFGVQRDIHAYCASLKRLSKFMGTYDTVYPSHGTFPVSPALINKLIHCAESVVRKEIEPEEAEMFGKKIAAYKTSAATFLMEN